MSITQDRVKGAEFVRNIFSAIPEHGTPFEDILKPAYWSHVAAKFHPTDRIEVLAEDGSWFAELIVISAARNWASVSVLRFVELAEVVTPKPQADQFAVQWKGQKLLHCVIRQSDKVIIKDSFSTAAEASKWLESYENTLIG